MLNFRDYLDFAEKQVMLAEEQLSRSLDANWTLIPATTLAWSAIESFVNNRLDDFALLPESRLQLHERAFLLEKKIRLVDSGDKLGQFILEGREYNRIENKIFFLIAKFGEPSMKVKKGDTLWQRFEEFKNTRDALVHPRQEREVVLSVEKARAFIQTSKDVIRFISESIWNKPVEF
jgi:hypothetical protein